MSLGAMGSVRPELRLSSLAWQWMQIMLLLAPAADDAGSQCRLTDSSISSLLAPHLSAQYEEKPCIVSPVGQDKSDCRYKSHSTIPRLSKQFASVLLRSYVQQRHISSIIYHTSCWQVSSERPHLPRRRCSLKSGIGADLPNAVYNSHDPVPRRHEWDILMGAQDSILAPCSRLHLVHSQSADQSQVRKSLPQLDATGILFETHPPIRVRFFIHLFRKAVANLDPAAHWDQKESLKTLQILLVTTTRHRPS